MRIGLLHPGEMGATVGGLLVDAGHQVVWEPDGRSPATVARAQAAGLTQTDSVRDAELIFSICPPHAALEVAESLKGTSALVIDANAVSPATATRIGETLGDRWVDGGIVGPPPRRAGTTRLYLSGTQATQVAELFTATPLDAVVLDGSPVAASALKMSYAAWTKGSTALLLAVMESARRNGLDSALLAEWGRSQPALEDRWHTAVKEAEKKGWRFAGEMREIAATFAQLDLPAGFHEAAAAIFEQY